MGLAPLSVQHAGYGSGAVVGPGGAGGTLAANGTATAASVDSFGTGAGTVGGPGGHMWSGGGAGMGFGMGLSPSSEARTPLARASRDSAYGDGGQMGLGQGRSYGGVGLGGAGRGAGQTGDDGLAKLRAQMQVTSATREHAKEQNARNVRQAMEASVGNGLSGLG